MNKVITVEIADEPLIEARSGISRHNKPYEIPAKHVAYLHGASKYPIEFEAPVPTNGSPYKPGFYFLAGRCFETSEYGIQFIDRNLELVPVDEAIKALSAPKTTDAAKPQAVPKEKAA